VRAVSHDNRELSTFNPAHSTQHLQRSTYQGQATVMQARVMTQARTQTLMLAVTVVLAATAAKAQLQGRLRDSGSERGSSALEWAIIAAIAVAVAGVVGAKVISQ
jgi:hypothetical protein